MADEAGGPGYYVKAPAEGQSSEGPFTVEQVLERIIEKYGSDDESTEVARAIRAAHIIELSVLIRPLLARERAAALGAAANVKLLAYKGSPLDSEAETVGLSAPFKAAIVALSPDPHWLERREIDARIAHCDEIPHYSNCATLMVPRDPYPPCNCWVGEHRSALKAEKAKLGGGK